MADVHIPNHYLHLGTKPYGNICFKSQVAFFLYSLGCKNITDSRNDNNDIKLEFNSEKVSIKNTLFPASSFGSLHPY
jgi:hypothetical protein